MKKYLRDGRAPIPRKEATSRVMSANRGKNTKPEITLRRQLKKLKITGASCHPKNVAGRPDIAFLKKRLAIFINGCFWHRCPTCKNPFPKTHKKFWIEKFKANKARDKKKIALLRKNGWRVFVVWEHEIKRDLLRAAKKIKLALVRRK